MIGSLIILHGLFVLRCSITSTTCQVLVGQAAPHAYNAGTVGNLVELHPNGVMSIDINGYTPATPLNVQDLVKRTLVLQNQVSNPSVGKMQIRIPRPDGVFGANRLVVWPSEVLNGSDASVMLNRGRS